MSGAKTSQEMAEHEKPPAGVLPRRRRVVGEGFVRGARQKSEHPAAPMAFAQFPLVRLNLGNDESEGEAEGLPEDPAPVSPVAPMPSVQAPGPSALVHEASIEDRRKRSRSRIRQEQRRAASAQRQRHVDLLRNWMPTQRGANMTLQTRLGSRTVEGWFKRTFVRLARMLYRIHTFPTQQLAPEAIARIEGEVLNAIAKGEAALAQRQARCEEMLQRVAAQRAFYTKHFELEIIVSTKTAMALHAVYHRADELMLLVESLDFAGLFTDAQRRKQIGAIHAAIFGLSQSIERLHRGLYIRSAAEPEVDATSGAVPAGAPVDVSGAPDEVPNLTG